MVTNLVMGHSFVVWSSVKGLFLEYATSALWSCRHPCLCDLQSHAQVRNLFVCFLIKTTLKLIIMGLQGEWKVHVSFKERDMNIVEKEAFSLKPHTLGF